MSNRRPRVIWHTTAGAIVATYLLAAVVVVLANGIVPVPAWLALHLLVLGAATNAVFVWSRFFAQSLLHARPGAERLARLRLGLLNAGVICVLAGVASGLAALAVAGAALVVVAVAGHLASLLTMIRSSPLAGSLSIVAWYYPTAGAALAAGGTIGGILASGQVRSADLDAALVLAHGEVNLLGWLGLAVIGTEFMLWPMVLRTRMNAAAPRMARYVLWLTGGGLAVTVAALLASPYLAAGRWIAAGGMACYLAGATVALGPAVAEMRVRPPHTGPAWALLAGHAWLLAALAADTVSLAGGLGPAGQLLDRLLIPVLGIGVVAQDLAGALAFLLPVTVGGGPAGNRRLTAILDRGWRTRAALGNAGVLGLVALPGGWARIMAWVAVLAGFGVFPVLAGVALAAAHTGHDHRGQGRRCPTPRPAERGAGREPQPGP